MGDKNPKKAPKKKKVTEKPAVASADINSTKKK